MTKSDAELDVRCDLVISLDLLVINRIPRPIIQRIQQNIPPFQGTSSSSRCQGTKWVICIGLCDISSYCSGGDAYTRGVESYAFPYVKEESNSSIFSSPALLLDSLTLFTHYNPLKSK